MLFLSLYLEENIAIFILEEEIETSWNTFSSITIFRDKNSNGVEML